MMTKFYRRICLFKKWIRFCPWMVALSVSVLLLGCGKETYRVELQFRDVASGRNLPYMVPQPLDFFPVDSFGVSFTLPELQASNPLVAQLRLGNTPQPIYLLLDKSRPHGFYYDRLFIDLNKDRNFSNDGPPYTTQGRFIKNRNRHYVEFEHVAIPYEWQLDGEMTEEPFLAKIYFWYSDQRRPAIARIVRESWREGVFTFKDRRAVVVLSDDDCNGIYDRNDRWALVPEDSLGERFVAGLQWFRNVTRLGWIGDTAFEIAELSPRGDYVILQKKDVDWTREDDVARDNPYAEEPRRPRAARPISWLQDFSEALQKARRFKKPILVDFYTDWCGPCKVMEERTYTDAEVVQLSDQFICVRINGDQNRALVRRFNVQSYPTLLLLDSRGKEQSRLIGYQPASVLASFLRDALPKN